VRLPRLLFATSFRSFEGCLDARCERGKLLSLRLRSLNGRLLLSYLGALDCFPEVRSGMRLAMLRSCICTESDGLVLPCREGIDPTGEPSDRGCEIQSSDNESSQALSILVNG